MKYLYNKQGPRRLDADRKPFAFFVVGAVVVLGVVFVIGLQVGRYVERRAAVQDGRAAKAPEAPGNAARPPQAEIRKELNAFSDEAASVPSVKPQTAKEELAQTEKELTFRRTLSGKESAAVPLAPRAAAGAPAPAGEAGAMSSFAVQAGAFKDRKAAEALREKLSKGGVKASVVTAAPRGNEKKRLYRVIVGPFPTKEEANRAMMKLKSEMNVQAILVAG